MNDVFVLFRYNREFYKKYGLQDGTEHSVLLSGMERCTFLHFNANFHIFVLQIVFISNGSRRRGLQPSASGPSYVNRDESYTFLSSPSKSIIQFHLVSSSPWPWARAKKIRSVGNITVRYFQSLVRCCK